MHRGLSVYFPQLSVHENFACCINACKDIFYETEKSGIMHGKFIQNFHASHKILEKKVYATCNLRNFGKSVSNLQNFGKKNATSTLLEKLAF